LRRTLCRHRHARNRSGIARPHPLPRCCRRSRGRCNFVRTIRQSRPRSPESLSPPAVAFYGGLGDLLVTAAMEDWPEADEISLAYALSSWKPTAGTSATIQTSTQRRAGQRLVYSNHRMEFRTSSAPTVEWKFSAPVGTQTVVAEFTTADSVTIPHHLKTAELRTYMTLAPLKDLSGPDLSAPAAVDESGRSSQTFLVEAVARLGNAERRA